jgi:hypothetical protein
MEESELERFRKEWQEEVQAKKTTAVSDQPKSQSGASTQPTASSRAAEKKHRKEDIKPSAARRAARREALRHERNPSTETEPRKSRLPDIANVKTALELYEEAADSEASGSLGESVGLYRRAFRVSSSHLARTVLIFLR